MEVIYFLLFLFMIFIFDFLIRRFDDVEVLSLNRIILFSLRRILYWFSFIFSGFFFNISLIFIVLLFLICFIFFFNFIYFYLSNFFFHFFTLNFENMFLIFLNYFYFIVLFFFSRNFFFGFDLDVTNYFNDFLYKIPFFDFFFGNVFVYLLFFLFNVIFNNFIYLFIYDNFYNIFYLIGQNTYMDLTKPLNLNSHFVLYLNYFLDIERTLFKLFNFIFCYFKGVNIEQSFLPLFTYENKVHLFYNHHYQHKYINSGIAFDKGRGLQIRGFKAQYIDPYVYFRSLNNKYRVGTLGFSRKKKPNFSHPRPLYLFYMNGHNNLETIFSYCIPQTFYFLERTPAWDYKREQNVNEFFMYSLLGFYCFYFFYLMISFFFYEWNSYLTESTEKDETTDPSFLLMDAFSVDLYSPEGVNVSIFNEKFDEEYVSRLSREAAPDSLDSFAVYSDFHANHPDLRFFPKYSLFSNSKYEEINNFENKIKDLIKHSRKKGFKLKSSSVFLDDFSTFEHLPNFLKYRFFRQYPYFFSDLFIYSNFIEEEQNKRIPFFYSFSNVNNTFLNDSVFSSDPAKSFSKEAYFLVVVNSFLNKLFHERIKLMKKQYRFFLIYHYKRRKNKELLKLLRLNLKLKKKILSDKIKLKTTQDQASFSYNFRYRKKKRIKLKLELNSNFSKTNNKFCFYKRKFVKLKKKCKVLFSPLNSIRKNLFYRNKFLFNSEFSFRFPVFNVYFLKNSRFRKFLKYSRFNFSFLKFFSVSKFNKKKNNFSYFYPRQFQLDNFLSQYFNFKLFSIQKKRGYIYFLTEKLKLISSKRSRSSLLNFKRLKKAGFIITRREHDDFMETGLNSGLNDYISSLQFSLLSLKRYGTFVPISENDTEQSFFSDNFNFDFASSLEKDEIDFGVFHNLEDFYGHRYYLYEEREEDDWFEFKDRVMYFGTEGGYDEFQSQGSDEFLIGEEFDNNSSFEDIKFDLENNVDFKDEEEYGDPFLVKDHEDIYEDLLKSRYYNIDQEEDNRVGSEDFISEFVDPVLFDTHLLRLFVFSSSFFNFHKLFLIVFDFFDFFFFFLFKFFLFFPFFFYLIFQSIYFFILKKYSCYFYVLVSLLINSLFVYLFIYLCYCFIVVV